MPFTVPPNIVYAQPLIGYPSRMLRDPPEGEQFIPVEIDWNPATTSCYNLNVGMLSTNPISQICGLDIDNTNSNCDVFFLFPDSQKTIEVSSGASLVIPVETNSQTIYVSAPECENGDVVSFKILNFFPGVALYVPSSSGSQQSAGASAPVNSASSLSLIGDPSQLLGVVLTASCQCGATAGTVDIQLKTTDNLVIVDCPLSLPANQFFGGQLLSTPNIRQAINGLNLVVSNPTGGMVTATGKVTANVWFDHVRGN